ncbi:OB-fold putative lipoprotein [Mobiluncus mulieris]|nr:OB-fold putative lipoprotein [Mobiluncus mulieris]
MNPQQPNYEPLERPSKKPVYKRWWFIVLMVFLGLGVIGGIGNALNGESSDKEGSEASSASKASETSEAVPSETSAESAPEKKPVEPAKKPEKAEEPAMEVAAGDLIKAYQDNELGADKQYKGKVLKITGVFDSTSDVLGSKAVWVTGGTEFQINKIGCTLANDAEVDKAANLQSKQQIVVQGTLEGFNQLSVNLRKCTIVQ